jgi:hypothetical protein
MVARAGLSGSSRVVRSAAAAAGGVALVGLAGSLAAHALGAGEPADPHGNWGTVSRCESGGNWNVATGARYPGSPEFHPTLPDPDRRVLAGQVRVATGVLHSQGVSSWPRCAPRDPALVPSEKAVPRPVGTPP